MCDELYMFGGETVVAYFKLLSRVGVGVTNNNGFRIW
jgi:hypothetical protein